MGTRKPSGYEPKSASGLAAVHASFLDLSDDIPDFDFKAVPSHGGVFTYSTGDDEPIITLASQNIRQSVRYRLTTSDETRSPRAQLCDIVRKLWWTPAYSTFEADLVYLSVMRSLRPNDYRSMIRFGPAWFAVLDLKQPLPKWRVTSVVEPSILNVGPFNRRGRATEFVADLEHLFELCRDYSILEKLPHGQPCVYHEMGRCPAPCNGSISLDRYREMMAASARFATGDVAPFIDRTTCDMNKAAAARDYVAAARCREIVGQANTLAKAPGRYGVTFENFKYLVMQRGPTRSRVVPFFVDKGVIERGDAVRVREICDHVEPWFERARRGALTSDIPNQIRSEHVWLVAHFLMKQKTTRMLFLNANDLPTPDKFLARVNAVFAPKKRASDTKTTRA